MRRCGVLVVLAACGRIGFSSSVTTDGSDAPPGLVVDAPAVDALDAPATAVTELIGACPGATITTGVADTHLDSAIPGANGGARREMRVGNSAVKVSLIRFALTPVPVTATVFSAQLIIGVTADDALEQGQVEVFQMLEGWEEGTGDFTPGVANWTQRTALATWTTPGAGLPGSRSDQVMGRFTPKVVSVVHSVALDLVVVQTWVTTPATNLGMALVATGQSDQGGWLATREGTDPLLRPCFRITYVP